MPRELDPCAIAERSLIKKYRKTLWNPFIAAVKRSHLLTAWRLTPRVSATNSWVIWQRSRCSFKTSPRDRRSSAFSFRAGPERRYFRSARATRIAR